MKVSGYALIICGVIILLLNISLYLYKHSINPHHILMTIIGVAMAVYGIYDVRRVQNKN
jgi:hypothetical protein